MIVCKFGGTSVSTAANIKTICDIAKKLNKNQPVFIVSAFSKVTDLLILCLDSPGDKKESLPAIKNIHEKIIESVLDQDFEKEAKEYLDLALDELLKLLGKKKFTKAGRDKILAFGELISSFIISKALEGSGISSKQIIGSDVIVTDNNFGSADFIPGLTRTKLKKTVLPLVKNNFVPVVGGFCGATQNGQTTTLGRGGSDYTAAIIGYSLGVKEVQIWTDVDGIYTTDPRIVKGARILPQISYKEASELAAFGAKVLHPRTIKPAVKAKIPVRVLNTMNPQGKGTLVCEKPDLRHPITAISYKKRVTLVNIFSTEMLFSKGFLARVFEVFTRHNISVDLVSVSEVSVSVTLENDDELAAASKEISKFAVFSSTREVGMVSLIGEGVANSSSTIRKIFQILDGQKILVKMVSLGATDINLSLVIQYDKVEQAVRVLHKLLIKNMIH